jgi:CheY-like chemotaxis protein
LLDGSPSASRLAACFHRQILIQFSLGNGSGKVYTSGTGAKLTPCLSSGWSDIVPAKPRVLVVEDDLDSYTALSKILKHVGYETLSASTLAQALEAIKGEPRFVVLDLLLPDGNGNALLRHIRDQHLPIKVAVLTGVSDREMLTETQDLRPDAIFAKPLDVPRLLAWLRQGGTGASDLQ